MAQITATFGTVTGNIDEAQIKAIVDNNLLPVNQELATRAKQIDENLQELSANSDNTTFKHDRQKVSRKVLLGVSTTFSPLPPDNGWLHGDSGELVIIHQQSNLTVGVSGIDDDVYTNAPASDKAAGAKWLRTYRIVDGDMVWRSRRINSSTPVAPRRYFVKGNRASAHITIPTHNGATPLISHDNHPAISYLFAFKVDELEKTGSTEILWSKGAGSTGTSQSTISSAGLLSIGMGNDGTERITFADPVMDNVLHHAGMVFKKGTTNNGVLKAALDGTIQSRADIPNVVYNTAPINVLSLETGTTRFGTNAKLYYLYRFNRELTDQEMIDALSGKIPSDYVMYYPFINNANDVSVNAIHGIVSENPTFGFETIS